MATTAKRDLRALSRMFGAYGQGASQQKLELLVRLGRGELERPDEVLRLHEILCFLRAYPDDEAVLACVERLLSGFEQRRDLRRHRKSLKNSGIAGTAIHFRFFAPQARRLAERFPKALTIDWPSFDGAARLGKFLPLCAHYAERAAFDDSSLTARAWLRGHKAAKSDAAFLLDQWRTLGCDVITRDALYDDIDPPLVLAPAPGSPARTREKHPGLPVVYQTEGLSRARPDLAHELARGPISIRGVPRAEAEALIALACDVMVPRERDLEVFEYGNPDDVRLIDVGNGLVLACIGVLPERRSLLEAVYGFLMLKNGVAVGYSLCSALFGSSEIAYNVFESFRGGETASMFGRVIAAVHALFGSDSFAIDPYQLGHHNSEGLRAGAFWFYQKLGFRPLKANVVARMNDELRAMKRTPGHRSSPAALRVLASEYVFLQLAGEREDVLGLLSPTRVAAKVAGQLHGDRDGARSTRSLVRAAAERLGVEPLRLGSTAAERQAFERWAPLVLALPGVDAWSPTHKRALFALIRAKGALREDAFVRAFDRHVPLRNAVRELAQ